MHASMHESRSYRDAADAVAQATAKETYNALTAASDPYSDYDLGILSEILTHAEAEARRGNGAMLTSRMFTSRTQSYHLNLNIAIIKLSTLCARRPARPPLPSQAASV
jgi:hypothetical protein